MNTTHVIDLTNIVLEQDEKSMIIEYGKCMCKKLANCDIDNIINITIKYSKLTMSIDYIKTNGNKYIIVNDSVTRKSYYIMCNNAKMVREEYIAYEYKWHVGKKGDNVSYNTYDEFFEECFIDIDE
jgi:hypothetical protein